MSIDNKALKTSETGRIYAGVSLEQRQRERREVLLDTAFEIIGSKGFKAATVRAVCSQAGLSNRYYYENFSDAEEMLIMVYRRQSKALQGLVIKALPTQNPKAEQMVEAAFTAIFTEFKNNPNMARILFIEVIGVSPKVDACHRDGTQQFVDLCLVFTRALYASTLPSHLNPEIIVKSLVGAVIQITSQWILANYDHTVEEITTNLTFVSKAVIQALDIKS